MKVSLLTDGIAPWHQESVHIHAQKLASQLTVAGCEVDLYFPASFEEWNAKKSECELLAADNLTPHRFHPPKCAPLPGKKVSESYQLSSQYLYRYLAYPDADVIYATGMMSHGFLEARKKHGLKIPPIITNIDGYADYLNPEKVVDRVRSTIMGPALRKVIEGADYIVSACSRTTEMLIRTSAKTQSRVLRLTDTMGNPILSEQKLRRIVELDSAPLRAA